MDIEFAVHALHKPGLPQLDARHDLKMFNCGDSFYDRYLQQAASQDERRHFARTFVLVKLEQPLHVLGYYSLKSAEIEVEYVPNETLKAMRFNNISTPLPATLLSRFALDKSVQGYSTTQGHRISDMLLHDAMLRTVKAAKLVGSSIAMLEAHNPGAIVLYKRFGYREITAKPNWYFFPVQTLAQLFSE